ncbi:MAG: ankyrin repeat domain-containing protein [Candidatus Margulisbacteria bacterium]|nr:ankyrin repeat domain-containing protein [Candidatus Margulisiibacteriota bacterium]
MIARKIIACDKEIVIPLETAVLLSPLHDKKNVFSAKRAMALVKRLLVLKDDGVDLVSLLARYPALEFLKDQEILTDNSEESLARKSLVSCLKNLRQENYEIILPKLARDMQKLGFKMFRKPREENKWVDTLHMAQRQSKDEWVMEMVCAGADTEALNDDEYTLLMTYVNEGDLDMVKKLLEVGVDLNTPGKKGQTALFRAFYENKWEIFKELINEGADLEAKDTESHTVLWLAVQDLNIRYTKELLASGAAINIVNKSGTKLINMAVQHCYTDNGLAIFIELLNRGADKNSQCRNRFSLLHYLIISDNFRGVKELISRGCDLNTRDVNGETSALKASYLQRMDIMKELIKAGADLRQPDNEGNTPHSYAVTQENKAMVNLLQSAGIRK